MAYRYIGVTLPIRLGPNGMFEQSSEAIQQIRSNFKNLVLTKKGERIYQPEFGCDIWKVAFTQLTDEINETARLTVVDAIDRWMPFLEVTDFQLEYNEQEKLARIDCSYRFRNNPNVTDEITIVVGDTLASSTDLPATEVFATKRRILS